MREAGSIFTALIGAVGLVAVLGAATMTVMRGPVTGMNRVTQHTLTQNDLMAATLLLAQGSLNQSASDCDSDGSLEPMPWSTPASGVLVPAGGGILPGTLGMTRRDPWGTDYGYCVWDHGEHIASDNIAGCSGAAGRRLSGARTNFEDLPSIAVISAGPDRQFQTGCADYLDPASPTLIEGAGSDDIIRSVAYGQLMIQLTGQARLDELPDDACRPDKIGLMRLSLGIVQICTDAGWTEVGTAANADANFNPVTNAMLNSAHESNEIRFDGFLNKKTVVVEGPAVLLIDGTPVTPPAEVSAGQQIALRATAPSTPETTLTVGISVSGVRKTWTITTRDAYPPSLSLSPNNVSMSVTGPGNPAHGSIQGFVLHNSGERATNALSSAMLSNPANFTIDTDDCATNTLAGGGTCAIDVTPRASDDGTYTGILSISDGTHAASADMTINATGWRCTLPWGGNISHNQQIAAYVSNNVSCGTSCVSEQRSCSGGFLSGSYEYASCNPLLNCSYTWYQSGFGSCTASCGGGTQTQTVYCRRSDGTTADDSLCSGSKPASLQSCNTHSCYSYSWYTGSYGSCSVSCGSGQEYRTVYCRRSDGVQVTDGYCSGSKPATSRSCNAGVCCSSYSGSCSPYSAGVCAGSCGGHYQNGTWCQSTWNTTSCPSGCTKVMQGSYSFYCR